MTRMRVRASNRLDVDVAVVQGVHVFVKGVDVDKPMGEIKVNAPPERDCLVSMAISCSRFEVVKASNRTSCKWLRSILI